MKADSATSNQKEYKCARLCVCLGKRIFPANLGRDKKPTNTK